MPLTPSIQVSQTALTPNIVVVTDNSTGSDVAITQRRIFVEDNQGDFLVPSGTTTDYVAWAFADPSISLNILTTDKAVSIIVQWLDVNNNVLYTFQDEYCLSEYNKQFFYYLIQQQGDKPKVVDDTDYDRNAALLWTNIHGAIVAVEDADDISASQNCLDRASFLRLNQNKYFGVTVN